MKRKALSILRTSLIVFFTSFLFSQAAEISGPDNSNSYTAESGLYSIVITADAQSSFPGSISSMARMDDGIQTANGLNFMAPVNISGNSYQASNVISHSLLNDSTLQVVLSGAAELNLEDLIITQIWTAHEKNLELELIYSAQDSLHVVNDACLRFEENAFSNIACYNTASYNEFEISNLPDNFEYSTQNGLILKNNSLACHVRVKNPFYGIVRQENAGISIDIMRTIIPNATNPDLLHSEIAPGHEIKRNFLISLEDPDNAPFGRDDFLISPSPHAFSGNGTILFTSDDLPLRSNWITPTDHTNPETPIMSMILRMLHEIPRLNLGFVIVFDKIMNFWSFSAQQTDGWYMNRGNFSYVPFDSYSGDRSLRMEVSSDTSLFLWQNIYLNQDEIISISAYTMMPYLLNVDGGLRMRILDIDGNVLDQSTLYNQQNNNWYNISWTSNTPIPSSGNYKIQFMLEHADGSVFVDDIEVTADARTVNIQNPGFETGVTEITYDADTYTWWDASSTLDIAALATEEYLDFLHRIDNDENLYGWESRLYLGIHSHHHSQHGGFVGPSAGDAQGEWDQVEDENHHLVFDAIYEDVEEIGLSDYSLKFIRTSGVRYMHETVQAALTREIEHFDQGYSENVGKFYPVYGHGREIWLQGLNQWMDNPNSSWSVPDNTRELLDKGNICLWGWHPGVGLDGGNEARFEWLSEIINDINADYPDLVWDRPQDVTSRAKKFSSWTNVNSIQYGNDVIYTFSGEAEEGMSLFFFMSDSFAMPATVWMDGIVQLNVEGQHPRYFVTLPSLYDTDHTIDFTMVAKNKKGDSKMPIQPDLVLWPVPSNGYVNVKWQDNLLMGNVHVSVYNTLGRMVKSDVWRTKNNKVNRSLILNDLASGTYFIQLEQKDQNLLKTNKIILLK